MTPRQFGFSRRLRVGLFGIAVLAFVFTEGCARMQRRDTAADAQPAYLSRFPTLGSDLKAAPRGVSIPASGTGVDLVGGWRGKMAKMVDDTVNQVAAPGFATMR